jgi:hypothetical protein
MLIEHVVSIADEYTELLKDSIRGYLDRQQSLRMPVHVIRVTCTCTYAHILRTQWDKCALTLITPARMDVYIMYEHTCMIVDENQIRRP